MTTSIFRRIGGPAILLMLSAAIHAQAASAPALKLDIPAQKMTDALNEFARQSGLQILIDWQDSREITSPKLSGTYTPEAALQALLADSGLQYQYLDARTISVRAQSHDRGSEATKTSSMASDEAVRVAQSDAQSTRTNGSKGQDKSILDDTTEVPLSKIEQLVVTGTNIRGAQASGSKVIVLDRDYIDKSGFLSTQQLVRSLPQNFSGGNDGMTEDGQIGPGTQSRLNISHATGVNLRGLGSSATLVLINGRRAAPSGQGTVVDVSLIPLAAIERVEILADGASAIYGSDAVAGVVNFILRKNYTGAETRLQYGAASSGSAAEQIASQSFGRQWPSGRVMASLQARRREALSTSERSFSEAAGDPTDIMPYIKQWSGALSVSQQVSDRVELFADGDYADQFSRYAFTNPPVGSLSEPATIRYNVTAGIGIKAFSDWRVELTGAKGRERTDVTLWHDPPSPPTVNGAVGLLTRADLKTADAKADGRLFETSAGIVRAAVGYSYREEVATTFTVLPNESPTQYPRRVNASFAEVSAPLLAWGPNKAASLALSAAVRHEEYSDFGNTTNPKFGLELAFNDHLSVHASYGASFRAPLAREQLASRVFAQPALYALDYPTPTGGLVNVFYVFQSLPLIPEKAKTYSLGFDYQLPSSPQTRISVNAFQIDFRDRIINPPFTAASLGMLDYFGSIITRFADDAAAQAYLNDKLAAGFTYGDFTNGSTGAAGIRYALNFAQVNAAVVKQNGADLTVQHAFDLAGNAVSLNANVAYIAKIDTGLSAVSVTTDISNTYSNPLRWRGRFNAGLTRGEWQVNGTANFSNRYTDTSVVPYGSVGSLITFDLNARFTPAMLKGLSIGVSAINIFNEGPPRVGGLAGALLTPMRYDGANASPIGRFLSVDVRKSW